MKGKTGWIVVGLTSLAFIAGCTDPGTSPGETGAPQAPETEVYEAADVDIPPRPTTKVHAQYPFTLAQRGIQTTVELVVVVLPSGRVGDVKVESSTNPEFNTSAVEALRVCEYIPAILNGKSVACRVRVTVDYNKPKEKKAK